MTRVLLSFLFFNGPALAAAQDLAALVAGLQRRYASVGSVSARFTQIYRAPGIEQTESGILFMKKPGLMRWEYRDPETKLFVADGRNAYLYTPGDRQVIIRPFSANELRSTPLRFLLGQGDIEKDFKIARETEFTPRVEATFLVRLVPRSPQPDYEFLVVECDEKTFDLRRIAIREITGNLSEFLLTDLETNIKVRDSQFQFRIPRGVEVVHLADQE